MTTVAAVIDGRVVSRRNGRGAAGLRVELWPRDGSGRRPLAEAKTEADGGFKLTLPDARVLDGAAGASVLLFRVFDGATRIDEAAVSVRAPLPSQPAERVVLQVDLPPSAPAPGEVLVHELGETIAVSVALMQQELARYPTAGGGYLLDEIEVSVPLRLRVDELGQVLATVVEQTEADRPVSQVTFRIKPSTVPAPPAPPPSPPLSSLGSLKADTIQRLAGARIFSVEDLLRVTRNAAGQAAVARLAPEVDVEDLRRRAGMLTVPTLPPSVAAALLRAGITSATAFVQADPASLAGKLTELLREELLGEKINPEDVKAWQDGVRQAGTLALPTRRPTAERGATR